MSTLSTRLAPFALALVTLACAACPDANAPANDEGGPGRGAGGRPGSPGKVVPTSCIYLESSTMYCPDIGPTDIGGDEELLCREHSNCDDVESERSVAVGCSFTTTRLVQDVFEGSCEAFELVRDAYERAQGGGAAGSGGASGAGGASAGSGGKPGSSGSSNAGGASGRSGSNGAGGTGGRGGSNGAGGTGISGGSNGASGTGGSSGSSGTGSPGGSIHAAGSGGHGGVSGAMARKGALGERDEAASDEGGDD